jgi:O-antigen ligase
MANNIKINFQKISAKFNVLAENFGVILITLFPATMLPLHNSATTIYFLLALISSVYLLLNFKKISLSIKRIPKWLLLAFFAYPLAFILQFLVTHTLFHNGIDVPLLILFAPIILIFLTHLPKEKMSWPFYASILGVLGCLLIANFNGDRLTIYYMWPTIFGCFVIILSTFSIGAYFLNFNRCTRGLSLLALFAAFYMIFFSETRSAWLACIFISGYVFYKMFKHHLTNYLALAAIVMCFVGLFHFNENVNQRINQAIYELTAPLSEVKDTSLGIRKQYQKASFILIKESYLVGIGHNEFKEKIKALQTQKIVTASLTHGHPHNQYLYSFVELGITGFLGLLAMLFAPMLFFLKHHNDSNQNIKIFANIGMLIVGSYMIFGMSEVLMTYNKQRAAIYILAIFIPMASILNQKYLHPKLTFNKKKL